MVYFHTIIISIAWVLTILLLFASLPPRRAVIVSTMYGLLLGAVLFDTRSVLAFRPRWFDLPMAIWCLVPFGSSVTNGLGAYDGGSGVLDQLVRWGIAYFIGRIYF